MTVFMYFDFAVDVNIFHTVFCEKKVMEVEIVVINLLTELPLQLCLNQVLCNTRTSNTGLDIINDASPTTPTNTTLKTLWVAVFYSKYELSK